MTKLITILIILLVLWGGWGLYSYWEKIRDQKVQAEKQEASANINPESLSGVPYQLQDSLRKAQQQGPDAMHNWLKTYGHAVQDPRKAWLELDDLRTISRTDPREARRIFAEVKKRTPPSSPVYPRIQELSKTYE